MLTCSDEGFFILMVAVSLTVLGLAFDIKNQVNLLYKKCKKTQSFFVGNSVMEHTKEIMNPLSFDEEIRYASKELASIHKSLQALHDALATQNDTSSV